MGGRLRGSAAGAALALAALALAAAGPATAQVREVGAVELPLPAAPEATHDLAVSAYLFEGSRWDEPRARAALTEAAATLGQCGIAVAVRLARLQAPRPFHVLFTPVSRTLARLLPPARPAVIFVDDTRQRPAFDAEAVGRANARTRPEMADTVWITHASADAGVAIAHELVHVLADSGAHSTEPGNLMAETTAPTATHLTAAQCAQLRERALA
ncbi:MAG: hypothetical protein JNM90_16010, partial [Burkholderiales bacterium]|nr:hypothetical protein [Burkholderiales bacterium]